MIFSVILQLLLLPTLCLSSPILSPHRTLPAPSTFIRCFEDLSTEAQQQVRQYGSEVFVILRNVRDMQLATFDLEWETLPQLRDKAAEATLDKERTKVIHCSNRVLNGFQVVICEPLVEIAREIQRVSGYAEMIYKCLQSSDTSVVHRVATLKSILKVFKSTLDNVQKSMTTCTKNRIEYSTNLEWLEKTLRTFVDSLKTKTEIERNAIVQDAKEKFTDLKLCNFIDSEWRSAYDTYQECKDDDMKALIIFIVLHNEEIDKLLGGGIHEFNVTEGTIFSQENPDKKMEINQDELNCAKVTQTGVLPCTRYLRTGLESVKELKNDMEKLFGRFLLCINSLDLTINVLNAADSENALESLLSQTILVEDMLKQFREMSMQSTMNACKAKYFLCSSFND